MVKTTAIIKKTVMEKDQDGFVRPVTGVFELNLETKEKSLKQKINKTIIDKSTCSVIDTYSPNGEVERRGEVVKRITPAAPQQQKNTAKDQQDQIKKNL